MRFLLILFFLICGAAAAQNSHPVVDEKAFPGIKVNRAETYDGSSLWGYINGGADLYLEYGFAKLTAREVVYNGNKYRIDIYEMNNAESAFGIFSVSKFKCSPEKISLYSCVTDYQITAAKGAFFISVINEKGSRDEQAFARRVMEYILSNIKVDEFKLPEKASNIGDVKLVKGILGIQNSIADWEGMFGSYKNFKIYFSSEESDAGYKITAYIKFASRENTESFISESGAKRRESSPGAVLYKSRISDTELWLVETGKVNN